MKDLLRILAIFLRNDIKSIAFVHSTQKGTLPCSFFLSQNKPKFEKIQAILTYFYIVKLMRLTAPVNRIKGQILTA